ncbi:MAG: type II 3-dehydroquinate dehydratase [Cytophagales bacterium]|uniref:type II 3-dehydroquinate dehydratase n=1 Tax=Cyclobacterium marinum TaxID=104 RepID=UPI0011EFBD53|nr:type II 3-dehydroquinate dehydratase [Cyclobacterium marinum]MBI0400930.1 type II 3-dehydroquinate dehydratase [Cyclobacterium marinum]MBR9774021.1 type II 3-dehydroquinate dehydratase [Cytophagales bacterium]
MKITIINGPNLNLLGKREPEIYGSRSFEDYFETLVEKYPDLELTYYQSNVEGELVNKLHEVGFEHDAILINAGAYTHTSVAISDAIAGINTPVLEIHISNIYKRETFRHKSIISKECVGMIAGLGLKGYELGLNYFIDNQKENA